jgi:soluble lytic murein transglycosylase
MRVPIRFLLAGLALFLAGAARAQGPDPLIDVRADRWAEAQAEAARYADPVAEKLILYLRLRAPGAATAAEIADFMQRNPDWPAQSILERRREEAIASDPDDAAVLAQCTPTPALAAAMLRCAEATANAGHIADADAIARRAWVNGIDTATAEAGFLHRWAGIATPDDQWARFQHLAWLSDSSAAARQVARLDPAHQAAAEARLAAKRDDPRTEALVAALPPALRDDPGLTLERARAMRRTDHDADAAALLIRTPDAGNLPAYWAERNLLARKLLREGDARTAYAVVVANRQTADEARADAAFLAGFIALRMLHDPMTAAKHFAMLAESHSIITQGRAHYWLGRALAAEGKDPKPEYEKAATWPTTFYGQLAILALGKTPATYIARLRDPTWTRDAALAFTEHEVLRAAAWLIAWGDPSRARVFLTRMDELDVRAAGRHAGWGGVRCPPHGAGRAGVAACRLAHTL